MTVKIRFFCNGFHHIQTADCLSSNMWTLPIRGSIGRYRKYEENRRKKRKRYCLVLFLKLRWVFLDLFLDKCFTIRGKRFKLSIRWFFKVIIFSFSSFVFVFGRGLQKHCLQSKVSLSRYSMNEWINFYKFFFTMFKF